MQNPVFTHTYIKYIRFGLVWFSLISHNDNRYPKRASECSIRANDIDSSLTENCSIKFIYSQHEPLLIDKICVIRKHICRSYFYSFNFLSLFLLVVVVAVALRGFHFPPHQERGQHWIDSFPPCLPDLRMTEN